MRQALEKALKLTKVRCAMDEVMHTLGTADCKVPEEAVALTRGILSETFGVQIDEDIGKGVRGDTRSRYFANIWEALLHKHHVMWVPGSGAVILSGVLYGAALKLLGSREMIEVRPLAT